MLSCYFSSNSYQYHDFASCYTYVCMLFWAFLSMLLLRISSVSQSPWSTILNTDMLSSCLSVAWFGSLQFRLHSCSSCSFAPWLARHYSSLHWCGQMTATWQLLRHFWRAQHCRCRYWWVMRFFDSRNGCPLALWDSLFCIPTKPLSGDEVSVSFPYAPGCTPIAHTGGVSCCGSLHLTTLGHHCWLSGIPRLHTPARLVVLDVGKGNPVPLWAILGV